jgi:hypothetical protein
MVDVAFARVRVLANRLVVVRALEPKRLPVTLSDVMPVDP